MGILCYPQSYRAGAGGNCPTQNFVDRFETLDGDLLITEEDRRAAIEAGHYNEQNPYANRDPRLNLFIVHDGSTQTYVKGLKKVLPSISIIIQKRKHIRRPTSQIQT